jgi:hypothetical protein
MLRRTHHTSRPPRAAIAAFAFALAFALAFARQMPAAAAEPADGPRPGKLQPWELQPYRIALLVAVEAHPDLRSLAEDLPRNIEAEASSLVGGPWRLRAQAAPAELRQQLLTAPADVPASELASFSAETDKIILLAVRFSADGFVVTAVEHDVATGLRGAIRVQHVRQVEGIASASLRALLAAFSPVARIESVEAGNVVLRMRASAIPLRDASLSLLAPGAAFRPVLVECDAAGNVAPGNPSPGKATLIKWTYLVPSTTPAAGSSSASNAGALLNCRLETGLSGTVIPAYHPLRQRWAVAVAPATTSTRVRLVNAVDTSAPLAGYELLARAEPRSDAAESFLSLGISDREGRTLVPPSPSAVRTIFVRHGDALLARFPLVPGLSPEVTFVLADDRLRLELETKLAEIEDGLIDYVARREALLTRIRDYVKNSEIVAANQLRQQLRDLAKPSELLPRLDPLQTKLSAANPELKARLQARIAGFRALVEKVQAEPAAE